MDEIAPPFPLPPEPTRSRRMVGVLLTAVVVLLVTGGGWVWWQWSERGDNAEDLTQAVQAEAKELNVAYNDGRFAEALATMERILGRDEDSVSALLFAAATWAQRGQIEYKEAEYGAKAIALAERALAINPANAEAFRVLGYAHEIQKQWDVAIDYYNQAIALDNQRGELYAHRGHVQDLAGDFAAARQDYERALELDGESLVAAENLARIYMREGDFGQARDLLVRVAERTDNQRLKAEAYYNLSYIALHLDEDAVASLEWATKSVETDPIYPLAYVGQARIYIIQDQREAAEQALTQAFELYPDLTAAYVWLGIGYSKLDQKTEAIDAFTRGKAAVAQDVHIMDNEREALRGRFDFYLAVLEADEGDTAAAIELLNQSVTAARGDVITLRLLENGFRAGTSGMFAPLVGVPEYEALAAPFVRGEQSAELLSGTLPYEREVAGNWSEKKGLALVPVAQAEIINFCPHCNQGDGAGADFDAHITNLLTQFVRRQINMASLAQQCQAAVQLSSGGTQNCLISTDAATGVITIGCTNVIIAQYIPRPPTAVIHGPTTACVDDTVVANALLSHDPDGVIDSYRWRVRVPPFNRESNRILIGGSTGSEVRFPVERTGRYVLELTVTDDEELTNMTSTPIQVSDDGECAGVPPLAAVVAPAVSCLNAPITADGSGSSDSDGTITDYQWSGVAPNSAPTDVTGAGSPAISFVGSLAGTYTTQLTVTDNEGLTGVAQAQTSVSNNPPVAAILVDEESVSGQTVYTLDGSTSYDPDFAACGDTVTYSWRVEDSEGEVITAQEGSVHEPTFTFPAQGGETYAVLLRVFDPNGASGSTTATLHDGTVVTPSPSVSPSASPTPAASASVSPSPSPSIQIGPGIIRETD